MSWRALSAAVVLAFSPMLAIAQPESPPPASQPAAPAAMTGLTKHTGVIQLPEAKARLDMGDGYYFLDAKDAKRVLTEAWGNPPSAVSDVLGLIVPKKFEPDQDGVWGAVVTFRDIGYVEDKDARSSDYDKVLGEMREGEDADNAQLKKDGFPAIHLVGWAEAPSYDKANHVLIWARELQITGQTANTLNYDIRVLGRYGVLSLNAVGSMRDLSTIRDAAASVRQTASFDAGTRYTDVDKSKDKMAGIGLAGLIAAGAGVAVAKNAGLLAVILAFGKKGLILIVAAGAAIANWFRTRFGGKAKAEANDIAPTETIAPTQPADDDKPPPDDLVT